MKPVLKFSKLQIALAAVPLAALALFTNMASHPSSLSDRAKMYAADSQRLAAEIRSPKGDARSKNVLRVYKRLLDNQIAAQIGAASCNDLLAVTPDMESGIYMLFPSGPTKAPASVRCTVGNGRIVGNDVVQFRQVASNTSSIPYHDPLPHGRPYHGSSNVSAASASNRLCGTATENGSVSLTCPSGQKIRSVAFASYGLPSGSCGSFAVSSACNASQSAAKVSAACVGQGSCNVGANNGVFGDPCYGKVKKLSVQVNCAK